MNWLVFIVLASIMLIVGCIIFIIRYIQKQEKYFEENKKRTIVTIVGYDRKTQISANKFICDFLVKFDDNDNDFLCLTEGLIPEDYPVGTRINVLYAKKGPFFHIEMEDHPPKKRNI